MKKQLEHLAKHDQPNILLAHVNDGVTYYRHIMPYKFLSNLGWNITLSDFTWGEPIKAPKGKQKTGSQVVQGSYSEQEMDFICRHSDILVTQRNDTADYNTVSKVTQALYRIPWVYDTDDNVHAIRPTNPGFGSYNPVSPNPIWSVMAQNDAFAVTVSTQNLKDIYSGNNKRIFVLPNGVDMNVWDSSPKGKKPAGEIRISLMLSGGHFESLLLIENVLIEVLKAYPQVRLYVMDSFKHDFMQKLPKANKHQLIFHDWIAPKDWIAWNKKMNFDIGLAPLEDNDFNRAKSNLRLLEYGAQGIAAVASPVEPYMPAINANVVKGAHSEAEWFDAIGALVVNQAEREQYAKALNDYVRQNFDIKDIAGEYDKIYKQIIKEFTELYGEPLRDNQLTSASVSVIAASIDSIADRIYEDNTGKRPPKHEPSVLAPTKRSVKV